MNIYVVKGVGVGKTALSSFDAAFKDVGVYNYNLIQLSSIIPPNSQKEEYGHKLYVVKAEMRSQETSKYIAAGIGWYQFGDGRGLFDIVAMADSWDEIDPIMQKVNNLFGKM